MMARNLFKRTQVRLAATLTLFFTLATSTLFGLLVYNLTDEIEERVRARVLRTQDALVAIDKKFGFDELVNVVTDEAESVRDADSIFSLLDASGAVHAGNVRSLNVFEGWRVVARSRLPAVAELGNSQDRFFALWTPVSKGMLLVGGSDREIRQSRLILLHSLAWGLAITAAFGIGAGVYLARRAQRRIDDIASTMEAVAAGQLDRRIPTSNADDDLDQIAQNINNMLGRLQRLIINVNQASTDIAHDLKKPISRLRERLEVAREKVGTVEEFKDVVDAAMSEVDAIVATFEALLNISQLQAGHRRARFTDLDLKSVLIDAVELFEPVVEDTGGSLDHDVQRTSNTFIRGDRELLIQLFANLIENAIRHCPQGVRISVRLKRDAQVVVASITDNGPGIPEQERSNVFRRFYRLEPDRSSDGHGLGLSLVAAIADLHGAAIDLRDNDPGLRVDVRFPRRAPTTSKPR